MWAYTCVVCQKPMFFRDKRGQPDDRKRPHAKTCSVRCRVAKQRGAKVFEQRLVAVE